MELAQSLEADGDEAYIAYGQGSTTYEKSIKIGGVIENHLHNLYSRLTGLQGYATTRGTKELIRYICEIEPDIIHLRNLHGNYLNIGILFSFLVELDKPIVWTLHDCWAYTGKCAHYTKAKCYKWKTHCQKCPQIHEYPPSLALDRSRKMFQDKRKWFSSIKKMTIVPVSKWLGQEVKQSYLSKYPVVPIYNWINVQTFKPHESPARDKFSINQGTFVVLGVSGGWKRNTDKMVDFERLSDALPEGMQIVLVGKAVDAGCIPKTCKHIPYVEDTQILAEIFSMADVYVHLSNEDSFGKVIAESLACGTPAIVYDSTACPEVVGKECGRIVEARNIGQLVSAIEEIRAEKRESFSARCRKFAIKNYEMNNNIGRYKDLYHNMLSL